MRQIDAATSAGKETTVPRSHFALLKVLCNDDELSSERGERSLVGSYKIWFLKGERYRKSSAQSNESNICYNRAI